MTDDLVRRPRYLRAYYHTFSETGADAIDAILEAIAIAGKSYHSTSQWGDDNPSHWEHIQNTANAAADRIESLEARVAELEGALEFIAEAHDAGRHDGLPEPCPAHDADTMFAIARVALGDKP